MNVRSTHMDVPPTLMNTGTPVALENVDSRFCEKVFGFSFVPDSCHNRQSLGQLFFSR